MKRTIEALVWAGGIYVSFGSIFLGARIAGWIAHGLGY